LGGDQSKLQQKKKKDKEKGSTKVENIVVAYFPVTICPPINGLINLTDDH
jgi:hypothetical protein